MAEGDMRHIRTRGFTIVELLVVIAVIGILAAIVTLSYGGITRHAVESSMKADLDSAAATLEFERTTHRTYPEDGSTLKSSGDNELSYQKAGESYCVAVTNDRTDKTMHIDSRVGKITDGPCIPLVPNQQVAKLLASDGAANNRFGQSAAVSGGTAIIGTYTGGSAYIFTRSGSTWTQQAKLTPSDPTTNNYFGWSVAISGNIAIVGARGVATNGTDSGAAYIFTRSGSTWTQQAKLLASDGAASDYFGYSVAISGDTALVGAYGDDDMGATSGSAYFFTRAGTTWTQQAKITSSDGGANDQFGASVTLENGTAVIGATRDDDRRSDAGAIYIFTGSGSSWSQQAKLTASDGAISGYLGASLALYGNTVVAGAPNQGNGAVYVFTGSGSAWTQQAKLTASDGVSVDAFGTSLSLANDSIAIGSQANGGNGLYSGAVYVFTRSGSTWTQQAKLTASDGASSDYFGRAVAHGGDTIIIGSYLDDDKGSSSGSAYVFGVAP